ncbi:ImmA/IrrE family metallo-endopeptidase [Brevibacillus choshinensis]|nr:ImmA/IrrE family metallo-endopeptidase [Brevibacillus choshinensis]
MLKELWKPQTWLEEQVYMLLRYHGIENPEEIDLLNLCKSYRIEVQLIVGRSRTHTHPFKQGWYLICIDSSLDPVSRRLRIAHEFGHLVLHVGVQPNSCELMIEWQESQINHFVEHLLMPFYMFERLAYKVSFYEAPKYISQVFMVPENVAKKRFDRFVSRMYAKGYSHYI